MDPLAEKYYTISPYAYCAGNPVKYIDPTGKQIEETVYYYQYNIYPLLVVNNERNLNRGQGYTAVQMRSTAQE